MININENIFKVGDKITPIEGYTNSDLKLGNVYIVTETNIGISQSLIHINTNNIPWTTDRFKLYK